MKSIRSMIANFTRSLTDDSKRIRLQFIWIYGILFCVSAFMSVVNLFTFRGILLVATIAFSILCLVNIALARSGEAGLKISALALAVEIIALFVFFIVSGVPEGFSAIWICLLPSSGMLLFQRRNGTLISLLMFFILLFFFETPFGQSLLQYEYTTSFKLRFPMLYLAFFAISFFLETVRTLTYNRMKAVQSQYEHLYTHDALTGLYNRYGFNERLNLLFTHAIGQTVALMILDLDHFKDVNDKYGHVNGDIVLAQISAFFMEACAGKGDVFRWGGEEFAILISDGAEAEAAAERIRLAVQELPIKLSNAQIHITVSIGVAITRLSDKSDPDKLVSRADGCLFIAKNNGRNQIACETL